MDISAQVSLYPLGQEDLSPFINEVVHIFRQQHLQVIPGAMSTLIYGDSDSVFTALQSAFGRVAGRGHMVMVLTVSNACPMPETATRESK